MTQPFPAQKLWSRRISSWKDGAAAMVYRAARRTCLVCGAKYGYGCLRSSAADG
jgi:hypothetical protein